MESDSGEMVFEITSEYQEKEESSNLENNNNETKKRNDRRRNKKERVQKDKKSNLGKARRKNSRDEINLEEVQYSQYFMVPIFYGEESGLKNIGNHQMLLNMLLKYRLKISLSNDSRFPLTR